MGNGMNETPSRYRITAWGAAGLAVAYSLLSQMVMAIFETSTPIYWFGHIIPLSLLKCSGCMSLAFRYRHDATWLLKRMFLLQILDVLLYHYLWRFLWMIDFDLIWQLSVLELIDFPYHVISAILPFIIFYSPKISHKLQTGHRIPLFIHPRPLCTRIWFIIVMVVILPSFLHLANSIIAGRISAIYATPSNHKWFYLLADLHHSIYFTGYMTYFWTRLAEWAIYQRNLAVQIHKSDDSADAKNAHG